MATTPNVQKGTPGKLLLGFSLLLLLAAAAAIEDWGHRDQIEEFEFPTGLQDDSLFPSAPEGFSLDKEIVKIGGDPFFSTRRQPVGRGDDVMLRVALDDTETWFVYQYGKDILRGRADDMEPDQESPLFLKTAPGQYLELSASPNTTIDEQAPLEE